MPETCRVIYNNKYIFASSWYLSSFSYMMQGHTYIKLVIVNFIYFFECRILRKAHLLWKERENMEMHTGRD